MSVTEIKIASIQDVEQVVLETQYDDKLMQYRSPALFRGLSVRDHRLRGDRADRRVFPAPDRAAAARSLF